VITAADFLFLGQGCYVTAELQLIVAVRHVFGGVVAKNRAHSCMTASVCVCVVCVQTTTVAGTLVTAPLPPPPPPPPATPIPLEPRPPPGPRRPTTTTNGGQPVGQTGARRGKDPGRGDQGAGGRGQ